MSTPDTQPSPPSRKRALTLAVGAAIFGGVIAMDLLWIVARQRPEAPTREMMAAQAKSRGRAGLPELWKVPEFSFSDQQNRTVTNASLAGKPWIVDFVFTTCTTVCPVLTSRMRLLQRKLPEAGIGFLSFSVDPAHDTPAALAAYQATWNPQESRWLLLSTDPKGLSALTGGMHVSAEPTTDAKDPILHSGSFFLVDRNGTVRGSYNSNDDDELARLVQDARSLMSAAPPAEILPRAALPGAELFAALGCGPCHDNHALAPPLGGAFGREVALASGERVRADTAYLREAVVAPGKQLVAGYLNLMPSYAGELSEPELSSLVEYLKAIPSPNPSANPSSPRSPSPAPNSPAAPAAPAAVRASAEAAPPPAPLYVDPVCRMDVRATETTPHAQHAGKDYYFCSTLCRDRFVADPESFLKNPHSSGM